MKDTAHKTNDLIKPLMLPFLDNEREKWFRDLLIAAGVITADESVNDMAKRGSRSVAQFSTKW